MIDFRYHLVSLISVFLALAVGIILGAGPLKEGIGNSLSKQITVLGQEKAALREDLDSERNHAKESDQMLNSYANDLLSGLLPDQTVAIIELIETDRETISKLSEKITKSGAIVNSHIQISAGWFKEDNLTAARNEIIAAGNYTNSQEDDHKFLAQVLVDLISRDTQQSAVSTSEIADIMAGHDLVKQYIVSEEATDHVLLVYPEDYPIPEEEKDEKEKLEAAFQALLAIVDSASSSFQGAVLASESFEEESFPHFVFESPVASSIVISSRVNQVSGQINSVAALSYNANNRSGAFGPDEETNGPAVPLLPHQNSQSVSSSSGSSPDTNTVNEPENPQGEEN